ncbi:MAG: hypothetical protein IJM59_08285 [Proteobacteria bacterium]|nr:hypothetical protein [Pseudomonadota bacterium]
MNLYMKLYMFVVFAFVAFFAMSCAEEGFTKIFECQEDYPYFSTVTHRCYKSPENRADAEKNYKDSVDESSSKKSGKNDDDDDDEDDEDSGKSGKSGKSGDDDADEEEEDSGKSGKSGKSGDDEEEDEEDE